MINYIMKKYALSRQGAKDLVVATISCVVHNLMLMLPVSLLYFLVSDLYEGGVSQSHLWIYIVGMVAGVLLILFSYRWVYGATYYATYKESSVRRISLAEKLRKLPLSFFGKKDLSDLTTTIMADCTTLEQSFSHWVPEFFGAMISTVLVWHLPYCGYCLCRLQSLPFRVRFRITLRANRQKPNLQWRTVFRKP